MSRNGQRHPARPRIELSAGAIASVREGAGSARAGAMPSSEEAAAITAAVEQFMRDTAPAPPVAARTQSPWLRAGLLEASGYPRGGFTSWGAGSGD